MSRYLRWLLPGLGLKRWLALSVTGVFLMGLGVSLAVRSQLYSRDDGSGAPPHAGSGPSAHSGRG